MIIIGVILNIVGLGVFCWALFTLAVYALPFFVGMNVGMYTYHTGTGPFGSICLGIVAGAFVLAAGQFTFSLVRSPLTRAAIALLFAVPAAIAGYHASLGLGQIGGLAEGWRELLGVAGAITVAGTAWTRMTLFGAPDVGRGVAAGLTQLPLRSARNG